MGTTLFLQTNSPQLLPLRYQQSRIESSSWYRVTSAHELRLFLLASSKQNKRINAAVLLQHYKKETMSSFLLRISRFQPPIRKFSPTFIGPFSIIRAWPKTDNYELELPKELSKLHPVYHVSLLKQYHENEDERFPGRANTRPGPLPDFDEDCWEINGIQDHRFNKKTKANEFLVGWKDWDQKYDSWEPRENFDQEAITEYFAKRGLTSPGAVKRRRSKPASIRRTLSKTHITTVHAVVESRRRPRSRDFVIEGQNN